MSQAQDFVENDLPELNSLIAFESCFSGSDTFGTEYWKKHAQDMLKRKEEQGLETASEESYEDYFPSLLKQ